jgi:hypothetical protein
MSDRGIDGLVHRLSDGVYIPVQAKGRSVLKNGEVHLVVTAESVQDDTVLIVSGLIVDGGLGPVVLVVPAGEFRRLAELSTAWGRPVYAMAFEMNLKTRGRWLPWLVASDRLAERFGPSPDVSAATAAEEAPPFASSDLGFLGESEIIRRLAEADDLNLFRPFPDLETAELVVRHRTGKRVIGLQVKTVTIDAAHSHPATVNVAISSFRPAPTTYFTVLAWMRDERKFHQECLIFPSERLVDFASEQEGHFDFGFLPGSSGKGPLDPYRSALAELRATIEDLLIQ